jgi:hypothetical protein
MIVTPSEFKGFFKSSQNSYSKPELQLFIDKFEKLYLCQLLGANLYEDFVNDLVDGVPQSQKYIDIFNAFCKNEGRCLYQSEGIKEMLKGFLFYEYTTTTNFQHTIAGVQQNESDNTTQTSIENIYRNGEQRFNLSVQTYKSIQWFICDNYDTYFSETIEDSMQPIKPTFQGII